MDARKLKKQIEKSRALERKLRNLSLAAEFAGEDLAFEVSMLSVEAAKIASALEEIKAAEEE